MNESGLLNDPRRTTCFKSGEKYYVGGHFEAMKKEITGINTDRIEAR